MIDGVRVFRSGVLIPAGCVLCAVPVGLWIMSLIFGDGTFGAMVCPLAASWLPIVAWVGLFRPRLIVAPSGVTVVEPLRKATVPWEQVERFDSLEALYVYRKDGPPLRATSLSTSHFSRVAGRQGHADHIAKDLNAMLARHRRGRAPRITADTAAGRRRLRLTPWYSAYPVSVMLALGGLRLDQLWLVLLGPLLATVATVALRRGASR